MTHRGAVLLSLLGLGVLAAVWAQAARVAGPMQSVSVHAPTVREAGRYLTIVGGCNDCHTPDWAKTSGNLDPKQWLTGNARGFTGPWGTSYASNLRLYVQKHSAQQWVHMFRTRTQKPPMPWMNLRQMSDRDLRAMYAFIHGLGPAGKPTPKDVPPAGAPRETR